MRVLVVTSMYPTPSRPSLGGFVRDQVEALEKIDGLDLELFAFEPGGASRFARAAVELRRRHRRDSFDLVHAHYGLSGWVALALGHRAPILVTFHGTDLEHRVVGPLSRALAPRIDVAAPV
ncbi:MAG TPA: glycosyltransferase, partial [Thermoleophilaceae bacterium]|nr:glycosyltransferase [Thermoleophilaceae bacterium]